MKGKSNFKRLTAKQQVKQIEMKRLQQQLAGSVFCNTVAFN